MKNKILLVGAILLIVISEIILFKANTKLKKQLNSIGRIHVENTLLKEGFFHSYDYESVSIDFDKYLFDYKKDSITLTNLTHSKSSLVLFVNLGSCNACSFFNIKKIEKFKEKTKLNILIGIGGVDSRNFKAFVSTNNIEQFAFRLPENYFKEFSINPVVYFIIKENGKTCCFYAPSDAFPDLTEDYFQKIKGMNDL